MRIMISTLVLATLAACGSGGEPAASREPQVEVTGASVRLPAIPGRPAAAYFTLRANAPARIEAVTSPHAERIELHDTTMDGGVARMGPLEDRTLRPDEDLAFAPGGKHAMLFGFDMSVRPGGTVPLTFDFEGAPDVTVDVPVEAMGAAAAQ